MRYYEKRLPILEIKATPNENEYADEHQECHWKKLVSAFLFDRALDGPLEHARLFINGYGGAKLRTSSSNHAYTNRGIRNVLGRCGQK